MILQMAELCVLKLYWQTPINNFRTVKVLPQSLGSDTNSLILMFDSNFEDFNNEDED
jgi:hypothetical protein